MNAAVKHAGAAARDHGPASYTISGFFRSEQTVNEIMHECVHRGVPRDLIDVAVSAAAAPHFFGGRARASRDSWFSWTGRGALAGLIISAVLTLIIVLLPGWDTSRPMAIVQLMGPDIGVITGAFLGALYGWLKPGDIKQQLRRAATRSDAVLMLVHLQPEDEADVIHQIFAARGGEDILVEPDLATSVGAE
jgi:hypothetical protein